MLRILLLLYTAALTLLATPQCRKGYDVMADGRCVRVLYAEHTGTLRDAIQRGIDVCQRDGATLPIIRSDEENRMFTDFVYSIVDVNRKNPDLILGLMCNPTTRRLDKWMDGSNVTYVKGNYKLDFDCVTTDYQVVTEPFYNGGLWSWYPSLTEHLSTILCVADPREVSPDDPNEPYMEPCGDYDHMPNAKDRSKPCFKIFPVYSSWRDAQKTCAADFGSLATISSEEENNFVWRSAIANKLGDDMHIGAYRTDTGAWRWIDDNRPITEYNNTFAGFPVVGAGDCAAMLTESSTARWINEKCDTQNLAFVCRRAAASSISTECPTNPPKEGSDIFPPRFPRPDIPCEYKLVVDANRLVQLEVLTLDANPNVDFLEIYEGEEGNTMLANLTGTTPNITTISTKSANVMRVSWKPNVNNRPANYRGFRIRYRSIAK